MKQFLSRLRNTLQRVFVPVDGGSLVEYVLAVALIAFGSVAGTHSFALKLTSAYSQIATTADDAFSGIENGGNGNNGNGNNGNGNNGNGNGNNGNNGNGNNGNGNGNNGNGGGKGKGKG